MVAENNGTSLKTVSTEPAWARWSKMPYLD